MKILPAIEEFVQNYNKNTGNIIWTKLSCDIETPVSVALKLKGEEYLGLFESVEQGRSRGRYSFIVMSPDSIWRCVDGFPQINKNPSDKNAFADDGKDVFSSLRNYIKESQLNIPKGLPPMSSGIFGFMGYDMVRYMEKLPDGNEDIIGIPEALFIRPRIVIVFDSVNDSMIIAAPVFNFGDSAEEAYKMAESRILYTVKKLIDTNLSLDYLKNADAKLQNKKLNISSNISREEYHEMVNKAKEYIMAGDIFQVVPSQRFTIDFPYDSLSLYRVLRSMNPSPYSFYLKMGDFSLIGSSPEILVRMNDGKITVRPIAGTRKRGADKIEDDKLAKDLLSDEKELAEHLMLIDLGRNDVGRVSGIGTVKVTENMVIEYYSHVMHIVSKVEGKVKKNIDALDAVIAGFPVGTVSGAPKIRAMEIIDELENVRRSFYAGGVGFFSSNGDVDMCITLRTGLAKGDKLYVQAGGGVVADSDPEAEYQESCNKAMALIRAAEEVAKRDW
ncbi:MAG: anthranilate synthase component I [Rickettsiales bacterium]|nr:anthranilate synthase component I [Pseudomonadota bacterium]MDA0966278.1 anthranilate synthase component I [Pseudomonadota bacterium]MDG4543057.1 anthranilate synthase component I [Rickettsiales bacterium]MDG4545255.1 anthranilate synthase component I [Rickettsiales bacterium]MDG4547704.1 anthranilate synthase component I [Rickettsiales bacterium]